MTLVSVLVPTYNRTKLLTERCLPSIVNQTHQDLDILVIGDGTEQETVDAMAEWTERDPRIRFWNLPHQQYPEDLGQKWCVLGLEAMNFGLDNAKGEWISALADDDEWELDAIESLLAKTEGVDFVYGKSITPGGQMYGYWPPSAMNFTDGSYVYRNGMGYRYDPACISRGLPEDGDLWIRMIEGGVKFAFLNKIVMRYYPNPR